jgi:RNA polymerase sigma-70 factor (ECF subfamily)
MMPKKTSLDPMADEVALVRRSQTGDQDAFACLYNAYLDRIYRYVYFRVDDQQLAEDITSQVFLKAWEKLHSYQIDSSPFIAWIYRIAHNTVVDNYRTRKTSISLENVKPAEISHIDGIDEKLDLQLESQQLREALQELTEEQQQVLILKFVAQRSTEEIAQQLGKQPGAIRAVQMRALQGLARYLNLASEQVHDI